MIDIKDVIAQRQNVHGDWADNARLSQAFKAIIRYELQQRAARGQPPLTDMMVDSLEMIVHKIGRILSGDAAEPDHWLDLEGYPRITRERLTLKTQVANPYTGLTSGRSFRFNYETGQNEMLE